MYWKANFNKGKTRVWVESHQGIFLYVDGWYFKTFEERLDYAKELTTRLNGTS